MSNVERRSFRSTRFLSCNVITNATEQIGPALPADDLNLDHIAVYSTAFRTHNRITEDKM